MTPNSVTPSGAYPSSVDPSSAGPSATTEEDYSFEEVTTQGELSKLPVSKGIDAPTGREEALGKHTEEPKRRVVPRDAAPSVLAQHEPSTSSHSSPQNCNPSFKDSYLVQTSAMKQTGTRPEVGLQSNMLQEDEDDDDIDPFDPEAGLLAEDFDKEDEKDKAMAKTRRKTPFYLYACLGLIVLLFGIAGGLGAGLLIISLGDKSGSNVNPTPLVSAAPVTAGMPAAPVAAPSVATTTNPSPSSTPTLLPTPIVFSSPAAKELYELICPKIDDCSVLLDPITPQGFAFDWLAGDEKVSTGFYSPEVLVTRYALATFYNSTNGNEWKTNTNWMTEYDTCLWFSTSGRPCVSKTLVSLELDDNGVVGEIPFELYLLTDLKTISIKNSLGTPQALSGKLPTSIGTALGAMTKLHSLNLAGNSLSGSFAQVGQLSSLQTLDLSSNNFTGPFPDSFSGLTKMTSLQLAGNQLSGIIPPLFFSTASRLSVFDISSNKINSIPDSIAKLQSLTRLHAKNNALSTFPLGVTSVESLVQLDLSGNKFSEALPSDIIGLKGIQSLRIANAGLTGSIPTEIVALSSMELLDLSGNALTGRIPSLLGSLVNLRTLLLQSNRLSQGVPETLVSLANLKSIRLDDNDLTGTVPAAVCTGWDILKPTAYIDCGNEVEAACFTHCCTDGQGCVCQFAETDPFRCFSSNPSK